MINILFLLTGLLEKDIDSWRQDTAINKAWSLLYLSIFSELHNFSLMLSGYAFSEYFLPFPFLQENLIV